MEGFGIVQKRQKA